MRSKTYRVCKQCGKAFIPIDSDVKYCSWKCARAAQNDLFEYERVGRRGIKRRLKDRGEDEDI